MSLDRLFGGSQPRSTGRLDSLFGPVRTNQQYDQGLEAPAQAPKPDYGFLGNIGDTVSSFTSGLQKNFNQSGVGQAAAAVESKIREPGEWLADRLGIAKSGGPGSPEYQAAQLMHFRDPNYVPTPEEVQAQGTYQNSILGFGLGGGLKSVGSVGRVGAVGSLAAREPLALPAPRTPELAAPVRPPYREGLTRGGPLDPSAGQGNYNTNLPPIEQPWGRIPQPASRYVPTGRPAPEAPLEGVFRELPQPVAETPAAYTGVGIDPEFASWFKKQEAATAAKAGVPSSIETQLAAQREPQMSQSDLMARIGVKPKTFADRVGALTPVGREDLAGRFAKPTEVPPVNINDLRARIGAKTNVDPHWQEGVPLNAEQLSARIGAKNRPQTENALRMGQEVEARQAKTGTLGKSGIAGPLVGRAVGRGNSQLARTGLKSEGLTATPGDLNASLVRQTKVHDANEAAIAAAKVGDKAAMDRALSDVKLLGGDLAHTQDRIRRSGALQRTTTDATLMSDMQASIDAIAAKRASAETSQAAPQSAASSLDRVLNQQRVKAQPNEIARALETEARRIMSEDTRKLPHRGLIGSRELQADLGGYNSDVVQSQAQRSYGSGLARGRNSYSPDASRVSLEGRANDIRTTAKGIRDQLAVIRDANAEIVRENKASRGAQSWGLSEEDRLLAAKSPAFRAEMGLHAPNPEVIAAAEKRITDAQAQLKQHLADAEAHGVLTPAQAAVKKLADEVRAQLGGKNVPSSTGTAPSVPNRGGRLGFLKEEGGSTTPERTPFFGGAIKKGVDLLGTSPGGRSMIGTVPEKIGGLRRAEQIIGATKTITTAASPAHFMFRHALPFMVSHPNAWFKGSMKGLGEGLKMTPSELDIRIGTMQKNLDANGMGNLYLGKPHLGIIGGEENVASNFAGRFGPLGDVIRRGGQGFVQGLNEVRYEAAKGALNTSVALEKRGLVKKITEADRREIADRINNYSGRGFDTRANPMTADALKAQRMGKSLTDEELKGISTLRTKQTLTRAANLPMFSPQLTVARVRMLTEGVGAFKTLAADVARGRPVKAQDLETVRLASGAVLGIGALYLLASAAGGKPDLSNPVAGTFGNVDIGAPGPAQGAAAFAATEIGMGTQAFEGKNVAINPTESESTLIRNIARMAVALYDNAKGEKNLMRLEGNKLETPPAEVLTRAVLSQLFTSPVAYPIFSWLSGFSVQPTDAITPMPLGSLLRGAGIQPPSIGGKPPATPKPAPAPKAKK